VALSWHRNWNIKLKIVPMPRHLLFACILIFASIQNSNSQPVIVFNPVISSGLTAPVDVVTANDGTNRVFIVEQGGTIKLYASNYTLLNANFLTISTDISHDTERGLLSLVFHPDFETNRYFFVYYTNAAGGINVDRFQTLLANPNQADAATRTNIMRIDKPVPFGNHNGGKLNFGPDGNLYFGLGDSGDAGDPRNFAQRGDSLWGKMVRINVNNFTTPPYYTVPADNPFVSSSTILHEIFSFGLRNPWRWSFDKLTGYTWIADVGQAAREEIDALTPAQANGANYGWRCYEGTLPYNTAGCMPASNYVSPIFDYPHDNATGGFVVTGGYVYRGSVYPAMYGYYVCTDFATGNIWVINASTHVATLQAGGSVLNISGFGELENGELVAVSLNGALYRVTTSSVLALQLLHWDGNPYADHNELNWQTADEINVKQFEVEYGTDGLIFTTAGTVAAKNEKQSAYSFRHNIQNNLLYYRLKIVHNNGKIEYSGIVALKNKSLNTEQFVRYYTGNPKLIWLNIPANQKAAFLLYNLNGQQVLNIKSYQNNAIIDLQNIPAGLYVGKTILADRTVSEKLLIK
jgi:glucose/arabinose dehydrogenase